MIKTAIVYTSQNGSTKKVADRFRTILSKKGCAVSLFNVHEKINVLFDDYDLIGFGSPTYIFRPSFAILDFIADLNNLAGKKVFTFVTFGTAIGDSANWLIAALRKKGCIDIGCFRITGRNLFPGYTKNGYLFSSDAPTEKELYLIESFTEELLFRFKNNLVNDSFGSDSMPGLIYRFERFVTNRFLIKNFYRHFFSIDRNKCIDCNTCSKHCPVTNITKNEKCVRTWGKYCILCLKCEISCPTQAISSPISWIIFKPFLTININRAIKKHIPFKRLKDAMEKRTHL